jgi:hypothetical protein
MNSHTLRVLLLAGALSSCASFRLPMTAQTLSMYESGPALLAYLTQADASAAVCDVAADAAHAAMFTAESEQGLVASMLEGHIAPALFGACAQLALQTLDPERGASLLDALAMGEERLLRNGSLETDAVTQQRLAIVQQLILERPTGLVAHDAEIAPRMAALRRALTQRQLGPRAVAAARELLESDDVDRGLLGGQPVDVSALERLAAGAATAALPLGDAPGAGRQAPVPADEVTLTRLALRLPSAALREEAARRLLRVRIARSGFPEVRAAGAALETQLLGTGVNAISLAEHPVLSARFEAGGLADRTVLVQQGRAGLGASLLALGGAGAKRSVLPVIPLRGRLWVQVQGLSGAVTACGEARDFDPTPCLAPGDVASDSAFVSRDARGDLHVTDETSELAVAQLASSARFEVALRVGGQPLQAVAWGLRYLLPEPLVFTPAGDGPGPNLGVLVEQLPTNRFVFTATDGVQTRQAVVEGDALSAFRVVSRGSQGESGADGQPGASGFTGGECSDGTAGQSGGDGGEGGPGADGGSIDVSLSCGASPCAPSTAALLRTVILSEGGPGGSGGSGGPGGAGGSGGPARAPRSSTDGQGTVVVDDPGCSAGSPGRSGSAGLWGSSGSPGAAGPRRFTDAAATAVPAL